MRVIFLLTAFLLICLAEEPSGRDSQLDSNRDVALKHNEQHQTQADHIVQLPDQVNHISQHQENEKKTCHSIKGRFRNKYRWLELHGGNNTRVFSRYNCIRQLYVVQNEKNCANTSFYGQGQFFLNALRDSYP